VKQGHDQDPDVVFVRRWVPELTEVRVAFIQEPWTYTGAADVIGRVYGERIVDLVATTTAAEDRIYGAHRSAGFHHAADAAAARMACP
jgi:deoxyribodipyrimidine photo-lyase